IQSSSFKYNIQVRGFKTERSIHADLKRNPNIMNRLRSHPENARGTKASKYLKLVQQLLTIVLFLAIFIKRFATLGGKLPKGVLLVGPPGTGKTLLARAVAGEARVPFFHAAGPEFDEILVGQGARRVRDLFSEYRYDQQDAAGSGSGRRGAGAVLPRGRTRTINQLLSEMDGFHQNEGVIVLGATNRRDDLDQALLRPGRFDVEITADVRTSWICTLHEYVIRISMWNYWLEAPRVSLGPIWKTWHKVLVGPERRSRLPDEEANTITAYHEGGHAVVAYYTKDSHPLHKVTIMPRGPSLGHTAYIPAKERFAPTAQSDHYAPGPLTGAHRLHTRQRKVTHRLAPTAQSDHYVPGSLTGAHRLHTRQRKVTHRFAPTAQSDHYAAGPLTGANRLHTRQRKVGLRALEQTKNALGQGEQLGPYTNELVDGEIKKILSESYERAKAILRAHAKEHRALAEALLNNYITRNVKSNHMFKGTIVLTASIIECPIACMSCPLAVQGTIVLTASIIECPIVFLSCPLDVQGTIVLTC
ncbi:ATP-dependent zinc metalloprotease YME1-like protein, partial [Operophtera brumata]